MTTTKFRHRKWLTGIAVLSLLLTGCWGHDAAPTDSHKATDRSQTTTTSAPKSNDTTDATTQTKDAGTPAGTSQTSANNATAKVEFPTVIHDAMTQFAGHSTTPLFAPTLVPIAKAGSKAVSAHTNSTSDNEYTVQLLQTDKEMSTNTVDAKSATLLGSYSGHHFNSTDSAQQQVYPLAGYLEAKSPGKLNLSGNLANHTVDLGSGITAQTYQFSADRMSGKGMSQYAAIAWQEGHWNLEVVAIESRTLPTDIAKKVVTYLKNNFLPVPHNKGAVYISVQANGTIQTSVSWQQENDVYATHSESSTNDPVKTALDMVMSMHEVQ